LAEVVAVRPGQVYVLESADGGNRAGREVDLAAAALIEPLAVAWHGFKLFLSTQSGLEVTATTALIIGAGPVGVAMAFVLRAWGVLSVFVSEPAKARRETLRSMEVATKTFDPITDNVSERCRTATPDGLGVGVVFDCAGSQPGFQAGCESLRFRGMYVNLAVPRTPVRLPFYTSIYPSCSWEIIRATDTYADAHLADHDSSRTLHAKGADLQVVSGV
jgi:threonine dehydrogenase-like Zn-dependent dehydrogenase